jgi:hypothetical protein
MFKSKDIFRCASTPKRSLVALIHRNYRMCFSKVRERQRIQKMEFKTEEWCKKFRDNIYISSLESKQSALEKRWKTLV